MATDPDPVVVPFPAAVNPKPDIQRAGRNGDDLILRRWRCGRFIHDGSVRWRLLHINRAVAIDHLAFHAAGQQGQAGGNQNCFYQS